MKNKHLSLGDRHKIENGLNDRLSFKEIGKLIDKYCNYNCFDYGNWSNCLFSSFK